jgi:hypothetical protein
MGPVELKVVKIPVFDTGIGREAGYESDAELIAAGEAQRRGCLPRFASWSIG